jgi:hypothetical protein
MDFWVVVATVLPVLGLPLVLIARNQVGQALQFSQSAGRFLAGYFALTLVAIYLGEIVALWRLATFQHEARPDGAILIVLLVVIGAGSALIASPGVSLVSVALAGQGVGVRMAIRNQRDWLQVRLEQANLWYQMRGLDRDISHAVRRLDTDADYLNETWRALVAAGVLTPRRAAAAQRARDELIAKFRDLDMIIAEYAFKKSEGEKQIRELMSKVRQSERERRELNLKFVWARFEHWETAGHAGYSGSTSKWWKGPGSENESSEGS